MADKIRVGIVGATVTQGGSGWGANAHVARPQAYARAADALRGRGAFDVDFNLAVRRHTLIDAIERSAATGQSTLSRDRRACRL